ncbi:MAG: hypothetical protein EZS28_017064 [Streblomastix strix]|uniref:Uncharacterized protein n=1 Tax=Streblomastix strix TaxID=222440 RepID=A0A5J4VYC9_9EUKA|nr:MAG: hypothetical protein EZS28_017064 [Streblomastix strix]
MTNFPGSSRATAYTTTNDTLSPTKNVSFTGSISQASQNNSIQNLFSPGFGISPSHTPVISHRNAGYAK